MKKGYTLIELLGVMVILAILIVIVFPSIINTIKSSNSKKDKLTTDLITNAAELFIEDNSKEFVKLYGNTYCITLNTLIQENYLKDNISFSNDKNIRKTKSVKATYTNKFSYEVVDNNSCNDFIVELDTNMIPVIYDGNNWVVADANEEWHNYENQQWANAVILDSSVRKKVGDIVTVDGQSPDALAMFVWVPRFEYKIEGTYGTHTDGKVGTKLLPGEIKINFISKKKVKGSSGYIVHPAFTFGIEEVSGIWIGKFETSHTTLSSSTTKNNLNCLSEECETADNLRILPNVQSIRYNNVSNFFFAARSMSRSGNPFGIDKAEIDVHIIKKSEWGAAAYLSQSKYGKYGNSDYSGANNEVYINNSSAHYTGRSGGSYGGNTAVNTVYADQPDVTTQSNEFGYYTYDGYLLSYGTNTKSEERNLKKIASTTGNIYGIYDMSGGANEYVMGVFANSDGYKWSGNSSTANSGFEGKVGTAGDDYEGIEWPNKKYYDIYKASSGTTISSDTACNGGVCFGHALSETSGWYGDYRLVVTHEVPWFSCGGYSDIGSTSGMFASGYNYGNSDIIHASRVVLTPIS